MQDLLTRARAELRHEPIEKRVRALAGAQTVVDSARAVLVWEPRRIVPTYAVPAEDIRAQLAPAAAVEAEGPPVLHPGIPFSVHTAAGEPVSIGDREGAGFRFSDDDLAGYVALDFGAFDAWYEEDEQIHGHPRDPYHRIDVRRTERPVRIEVDGDVVAESNRARLLFETHLVVRYYLPKEDVRGRLVPSSRATYCPYKGGASYWSVETNGRRHDDIGWSYEEPLPDAVSIAGFVAFWNERVDVFVDGELREPPRGPIADALRREFRV